MANKRVNWKKKYKELSKENVTSHLYLLKQTLRHFRELREANLMNLYFKLMIIILLNLLTFTPLRKVAWILLGAFFFYMFIEIIVFHRRSKQWKNYQNQ